MFSSSFILSTLLLLYLIVTIFFSQKAYLNTNDNLFNIVHYYSNSKQKLLGGERQTEQTNHLSGSKIITSQVKANDISEEIHKPIRNRQIDNNIVNTHGKSLPNTKEMERREQRLRKDHPKWFGPVTQNHNKQGFCPDCYRCEGKKACIPYSTQAEDWTEPERSQFDITMIMALSVNRLSFISSFIKMWEGPFCAAVIVQQHALNNTISIINKANLPDSFSFILYVVKPRTAYYQSFPINLLRNIAIRSIHTSHFLVMDADMRPSVHIYQELKQLPSVIIEDAKAATIVPSIFLKNQDVILKKCSSFKQCEERSMRFIPKNRKELISCYERDICSFYKGKANSHLYVNNQWLEAANGKVFNLTCFPSRFQEPYIMLKYTQQTVLFDERFIDYGCNKVQYVDYLRFLGYSYYLPTSVFATDIVHQPSDFRKSFSRKYTNTDKPDIIIVCYRYQEQLAEKYGMMDNVLPICSNKFMVNYAQIQ